MENLGVKVSALNIVVMTLFVKACNPFPSPENFAGNKLSGSSRKGDTENLPLSQKMPFLTSATSPSFQRAPKLQFNFTGIAASQTRAYSIPEGNHDFNKSESINVQNELPSQPSISSTSPVLKLDRDYTAREIAEYIHSTGDERGISQSVLEMVQDGQIMSSQDDVIRFLENVQRILAKLRNGSFPLGKQLRKRNLPESGSIKSTLRTHLLKMEA